MDGEAGIYIQIDVSGGFLNPRASIDIVGLVRGKSTKFWAIGNAASYRVVSQLIIICPPASIGDQGLLGSNLRQ